MIKEFAALLAREDYARLLRRGADIISGYLDGLDGDEDKLLVAVLDEIARRPEFEKWRRTSRTIRIGVTA